MSNQASYSWYWLLYANGIPMVAFWLSGLLSQSEGRKNFAAYFQSLAILLAFWLCTLEVHHAFRGSETSVWFMGVAESGAISASWILLAFLLRAIGGDPPSVAVNLGVKLVVAAAILQTTVI